jgi:hypothetical protein
MKKHNKLHLLILVPLLAFFAACSSPQNDPVPVTPEDQTTEVTQTEAPSNPAPTEEQEDADAQEKVEENYDLDETKTTLLLYSGDARYSQDDGESWSLADTGLWLDTGDRVQVTEGGLAVILFPDGTVVRLEGFSDFELVLNEFDFENGIKRVIGKVWDGSVMVTTLPLPNAESIFQLWSMTTFIDLPYDASVAVPLDGMDLIPEEERLAFGALMHEDIDGEALFSFSGYPDFYALEIIEADILLIKTEPDAEQFTQLNLPFRENIENEFELEGMLDYAASLVEKSRTATSITELDVYGYSLYEEGDLSENQVLYTLFPVSELDEFLDDGDDDEEPGEFLAYVRSYPPYKRHKLIYKYYKRVPDIFSLEILMQIKKYNLGCDKTSGLGCTIPESCNQDTGEGCELASGCNIITRKGCQRAYLSCIAYVNCDWAPCGKRPVVTHFCKPRIRTYCDPDVEGDCYNSLVSSTTQLSGVSGETDTSDPAASDETTQETETSEPEQLAGVSLPLELVQNPELAGQPLYDPNDPESTKPFYNEEFWQSQPGIIDDDDMDDDSGWCTCTASVPPNYPPPPPEMDMTYRCWCSE